MKLRIIFSLVTLFVAIVSPVYAQEPARISDIVPIIARIISLLAPMAAIAVFVMILVAGFQFLTSGGDPKSVGQARMTLTLAIIGIILVISAWLILLLIQSVTGVDVTEVPELT